MGTVARERGSEGTEEKVSSVDTPFLVQTHTDLDTIAFGSALWGNSKGCLQPPYELLHVSVRKDGKIQERDICK